MVDHKRWLESLKNEVNHKKERTMKEMLEEEIQKTKIKEISKKARQLIKEGHPDEVTKVYPYFEPKQVTDGVHKQTHGTENQYYQSATHPSPHRPTIDEGTQTSPANIQSSMKPSPAPAKEIQAPAKPAFKKKAKPAWALTTAENEAAETQEVDELLNFMDHFDAQQYADDVEVRELMANLKDRVGDLKKETNWKENWETRLKERRRKKEEEYRKEKESRLPDDDMIVVNGDMNQSHVGVMGGSLGSRGDARTVMSEKTQESINSIKEKMELQSQGKGDWNKSVGYVDLDFRQVFWNQIRGEAC